MHTLKSIASSLIDLHQKSPRKNLIVGISGIDASGKSSFAKKLQLFLQSQKYSNYLIHGDDFLFNRATRNANKNQQIGYYEETFNYEKMFTELIQPLKQQATLQTIVEFFDWVNDKSYDMTIKIETPGIILVEGVFLYKKSDLNHFDYRIWLDISFKEALSRALKRQRDADYYPNLQAIKERYLQRFYLGQALHYQLDEPLKSSDLIINALTL